ncbi:MAG: DUF374 domain-containing protein [Candidatus Eisenbacteria bacterium]|nr:DUF374 domain-containing protein [Candidatus Eisenbacteria bacterium]
MKRQMGVRDRLLVGLAGTLGPLFLRLLGSTWRLSVVGRDGVNAVHRSGRRVIHAFWHGQLLGLEYAYRGSGICVLSSLHRDGEISARLMKALGYEVVRGSTSRGSARGLLLMLRMLRRGHDLAVTPDGPRGPARVVKPGIFYLADKSGSPIVPVAVWSSPRATLGSWDGFAVPLPFARVVILHGAPIEPTGEEDRERRAEALGRSLESLYDRARSTGTG